MAPIDKAELCERLFNIVAAKFDVSKESLRISTRYSVELDADELDQSYYVFAIEENSEFGCQTMLKEPILRLEIR